VTQPYGLTQLALELQAAQPFWQEAPPLTQNARHIPTSVIAQPGPGPDPTNTQNVGFSFRFVPTSPKRSDQLLKNADNRGPISAS
jgi:aspartyl-tRNA(Asn)/glutamyl-tRNA(Gln) amidotransferase subunit A